MHKIKSLRWGIIACGEHTTKVMIPAFSSLCHAQLCALASQTAETRALLAKKYPQLVIHSSYQAAIEDPTLDALYIGLPNHLHAQWSIAALNAGKHVLCDKPLALSKTDALAVQEAATKADRQCIEGFMYRFHPQYQVIRTLLSEGALGTLRSIEAHFHYSLSDYKNIRWQKECGGGALADVGCYLIDVAHFLLQKKQAENYHRMTTSDDSDLAQVTYVHCVQHPQQEVDEFVTAELLFDKDVQLHLSASCNLPRKNSLLLYGTDARLEVQRPFIIPRKAAAELQLWRNTSSKVERIVVPAANHYALEIDTFSRHCLGESVDTSCFSSGVHTASMLEKLRQRFPEINEVTK